ncbi:hypothetical protein [Chamaesiphon sp. GL140_3_metabinner_50]|uniref:hypothetical protein n=1 Tax=Chamaesiphon sp. GL140_3_metabinner_50 TaxID=2970812 RepID=UPI0025FDC3EA|nr:hypothetical protein [Chamaesiphon sp. GL140_3_metabinner_50]
MSDVQTFADAGERVNFTPYSAIGTNLEDVRKRRTEHDSTPLKAQICVYLTPELAAEVNTDILRELSAKRQPIYGTLLTADFATFATYFDRLPAAVRSQIPVTRDLPVDLYGYAFFACPLPPVTSFSTDRYARSD